MELLSFDNLISLIIVFVSWLLVVFLLTAKTKNKTSNILLSLFLIVNAQDSSGLFAFYFVYPRFPGWGMIINATVFFKMPLLYLYLLSVIYSDFKFKKKQLWHLLPWVLNFIVLLPRYYAVDFDSKLAFLNADVADKMLEIKISYIIIHIQIAVYFIMSFIVIKKYKLLLLENYSNANLLNYKWLFQLITIFAIEAFIATLKNIFLFEDLEMLYDYSRIITEFLALIFLCWIVLKAMHKPELFRGVNSNLQLVKYLVVEKIYKINENVIDDEIEEIVQLKKHMANEEPFLNASLTIDDLSRQMSYPTKDLSVLINHNLNQHFFDFINGYRIRKAMQILQDPNKKNFTILEILYEVGFNSKSSFNTSFKKHTNLTPTQFRDNSLKKLTS